MSVTYPASHQTRRNTEWDAASTHFAGGAVLTVLRGHRPHSLPRRGDAHARDETRMD